jgi:peptidoglycan/LPS O-acetylase OafA/YrhL
VSAGESGSATSENRLAFYPALDGLRGVTLLVIFLFHLDYDWVRGGFLAVSTFYTLSGFLITGLLVTEIERNGRIDLAAFWGRRFRRLMPAALSGLVLIALFGIFAADAVQLSRLRGDGISALFYSANWWFIYTGADYADLMGSPSPSQHFWSLAIEEQYYFVYPLLTSFLFGLVGRSRRGFAIVLAVLTAISSAWMAYLAGTDVPSTRMYYGTDTRCAELLAGGVLGLALAGRPLPSGRGAQRTIAALGVVGFAINLYFWGTAAVDSDALYRGGIALYTLGSLAVITATLLPGGPIRLLLQAEWLQYIGRISYGAYVYHWPIILWMSAERLGFDGLPLAALRFGVAFVLAAVSYRFLEEPIRRRRRILEWRAWVVPWAASATVALSFVMMTGGFTQGTSLLPDSGGAGEWARGSSGTAGDPIRVLVVGDSVASNLFDGLKVWAEQTGRAVVSNGTSKGCGISRGNRVGRKERRFRSCDNWRNRFAAPIESFRPDVVVVYSSGWDMVERKLPDWEEPRLIGDPDFDEWLRTEYSAALDTFSTGGARVLWVSPLCVENQITGSKRDVFDPVRVRDLRFNVLARVAERNPDRLEVLDLYGRICPNDKVTQTIDGIPDFRPDGIHFSPRGKRWVGNWIGKHIVEGNGRAAGTDGT